MLGAIIGDIAGSRFEWNNHKSKEFVFFTDDCRPTDDSVMSLAVCRALLQFDGDYDRLSGDAVTAMRALGRQYPHCGYGGRFREWIFAGETPAPYNSYGNGAAMRVSGCGWAAASLEQAKRLAAAVTGISHNHPEGMKGAKAVAVAVWLAKTGAAMSEIRQYMNAYYRLDFTLEEIRKDYTFDVTCQGSVPQAIEAFLESADFEDAVRNAISIGGDSDTIAAITGAIAEAYYGIPSAMREKAMLFLDERLSEILCDFEEMYPPKVLT